MSRAEWSARPDVRVGSFVVLLLSLLCVLPLAGCGKRPPSGRHSSTSMVDVWVLGPDGVWYETPVAKDVLEKGGDTFTVWKLLYLTFREGQPFFPEDEPIVFRPNRSFEELLAMRERAIPGCIEFLRHRDEIGGFHLFVPVVDLVLIVAATGKDKSEIPVLCGKQRDPLLTPRRLELLRMAVRRRADDLETAWRIIESQFGELGQVEAAAWVKWYDQGMKTPLPPLIQYELDHPIGVQPEYYDDYTRPLYMRPEDLEGLPLPKGRSADQDVGPAPQE